MNRILVVATLIAVTSAMPLGAQGRGQSNRPGEVQSRGQGQSRATRPDGRDDRRDRDNRYERRDRDGTRRFIDRNGLECVEKSSMKNGRRSYDLKCREPRRNNGRSVLPPARGQDRSRACVDANLDGRCDYDGVGRRYPASLSDRVGALILGQGARTDEIDNWMELLRYRAGVR